MNVIDVATFLDKLTYISATGVEPSGFPVDVRMIAISVIEYELYTDGRWQAIYCEYRDGRWDDKTLTHALCYEFECVAFSQACHRLGVVMKELDSNARKAN